MWTEILCLLLGVLGLGWIYMKWCFSYWSSRGVNGPKPTPIIGNSTSILLGEPWNFIKNNYDYYCKEKLFGIYEMLSPSLFVCDPELIKRVLIKDFDHFADRRDFNLSDADGYMNEMLFLVNGEKWKKLRSVLSPTFSSGKMKNMYEIMYELNDKFKSQTEKDLTNFNSKDMFGRFAMEVISSCAFGIQTDSIIKEDCKFSKTADALFTATFKKNVTNIFLMFAPKIARLLGISFIDETTEFFKNVTVETLKQRRAADKSRGDFVDILLEEKKKHEVKMDSSEYEITENTLIGQAILFLVTGYDTTAGCLTFTSYYLAKHQECQDRLREELLGLLDEDGKLDYYKLMEAKYLDACISESLRLNPPIPFLERQCIKEYQIPDTNIVVKKNMMVLIPLWGLHRDSTFWKNPDEYFPDRFLPESKSPSTNFAYMPFGLGPRNCIAMRFALMEVKLCLAKFVLNFKLNLAPGHEELKIEMGDGIIRPVKDSVILSLEKTKQI